MSIVVSCNLLSHPLLLIAAHSARAQPLQLVRNLAVNPDPLTRMQAVGCPRVMLQYNAVVAPRPLAVLLIPTLHRVVCSWSASPPGLASARTVQ